MDSSSFETPPGRGDVTIASTETVAEASDAVGEQSSPADPQRGQAIGRYMVLERLGAGAMGVVFAAYDPELDRKVAIKVLHTRRDGHEAQARLVREAQALARVTHARVVAVHDVGVHEGRVFLAMEYVQGETLRSFLADPQHDFDERLRVVIAAGQGLVAAHAAGLVHRDFKPDNVMIGARGEVKVMDFGLARSREGGSSGLDEGLVASLESSRPSSRLAGIGELTEVGAVVGTPAYMAPEQLAGLAADARSDQFAFAVTVYEALYGVRPFSGGNLSALALAISEGRIDDPPKQHRVPPSLRRVIVRGLASDPAARWPELEQFLRALADPTGGSRRVYLGAGLVLSVCAGAMVTWLSMSPGEHSACGEFGSGMDGRWDREARAQLEQVLADDPSKGSATEVLETLDRYAREWDAASQDNCESTRLRASQSDRVHDLRAACLRHRRIAFEELVRGLVERPSARASAVEASGGLPRVSMCSDVASLELEPELPTNAEARAEAEALRDEMAAIDALIEMRSVQPAIERSRAVATRARTLAHPPVEAEAALSLGRALTHGDALVGGVTELRRAYFTAMSSAHSRVQAEAAIELVYAVGYLQQNHALGHEWADHAMAVVGRIDEGGLLEADAQHVLSVLADASGDHAAALVAQTRAYEIRRALLPASHPDLARSLNSMGLIHHALGEYDMAREYHEGALTIRSEIFGPDHPAVAGSLNNLALTQRDLGLLDDARRSLERAIEIVEGSAGAHGSGLARSLTNLADIERRLGHLERARQLEERSLALRRKTVGDDHPEVADSVVGLARIALAEGNFEEAEALARDGLTRLERDFAAGHPEILAASLALARVLEARGDIDAGARLLAGVLAESRAEDLEVEDLREAKALLERADLGAGAER